MSSMKTTVFFSWQTDTPTREGRNFIEKALKNAIKKLASDTEVEEAIREELEMDKDTLDVPGSPAIVDTYSQEDRLRDDFPRRPHLHWQTSRWTPHT